MLISSTHRFIFVHIPKTAGTSITHALEPLCINVPFSAKTAILRGLPIKKSPEKTWFQMHDTAAFIRRKLGADTYQGFTSFAVVRNPFDHAISHYEFLKTYRYKRFFRKVQALSFEQYLAWRMSGPRHSFKSRTGLFARLPDQGYYVTDQNNNLMVSRLLRFETLTQDLKSFAGDLGFELPELDHHRRSARNEAGNAQYLTPGAVQAITELYDRDFSLFDYDRTPQH